MSRFIVLEGLDGAGTTTQSGLLAAWLRTGGVEVRETHEPTDGPIGRVIRATLRGEPGSPERRTLPWLFAADRDDHLARTVEPALRSGTWVVSDRYLHSSLAYQSLELPLDEVYALNRTFRAPDLTVFVRLPVDTCLGRIASRGGTREIYERREALLAIERSYDAVNAMLRDRGDAIVDVDGTGSIEVVAERIRAAVAPLR